MNRGSEEPQNRRQRKGRPSRTRGFPAGSQWERDCDSRQFLRGIEVVSPHPSARRAAIFRKRFQHTISTSRKQSIKVSSCSSFASGDWMVSGAGQSRSCFGRKRSGVLYAYQQSLISGDRVVVIPWCRHISASWPNRIGTHCECQVINCASSTHSSKIGKRGSVP